jgi:hypothetical protein
VTGFVSTFDNTVIEPLLAHPRDSLEYRPDNASFDRVGFVIRRAASGVFPIWCTEVKQLLHVWQHIPAGGFELPFAIDLLKGLSNVAVVPGNVTGRVCKAGIPA